MQPIERAGFTLIEMAIVLVIFGALTAAAVRYLPETEDVERYRATSRALDDVERRLALFYAREGRLPCPADGDLDPSSADYGFEQCGPPPLETASVLPWRSLGLSDAQGRDGWGRRISYRASTNMLEIEEASGGVGFGNLAFSFFGDEPDAWDPAGDLEILPDASGGAARSSGAVYVLFSHGPSGRGGWDAAGERVSIAGASAEDLENLDDDRTYLDDGLGAANQRSAETMLRWRDRAVFHQLAAREGVFATKRFAYRVSSLSPSWTQCDYADTVHWRFVCEGHRKHWPECVVAGAVRRACAGVL